MYYFGQTQPTYIHFLYELVLKNPSAQPVIILNTTVLSDFVIFFNMPWKINVLYVGPRVHLLELNSQTTNHIWLDYHDEGLYINIPFFFERIGYIVYHEIKKIAHLSSVSELSSS